MTKKELVDEIMKASEDYPNAILYMESLMENYEQLKDNWNKLKEWLEDEIKRYRKTLSERPTNDIEYNNSQVTSVALEQIKVVLEKLQEIEGDKNV